MNATMTKARMKCAEVADKVMSSKAYKAVEKGAVMTGATLATVGMTAVTSFAEEVGTGSIDPSLVTEGAAPYIDKAIPILLTVAGIRLGWRFLRGSAH